jgi:hypothetical protein
MLELIEDRTLPSAEINDAEEPTPFSDDGIHVKAVGQDTEEHTFDIPDDSALTDPSLGELADVPTTPRLLPTPPPPRQRHRRILPTPPQQPDSPVTRSQRNRRPPQYLSNYVTSKQAIT